MWKSLQGLSDYKLSKKAYIVVLLFFLFSSYGFSSSNASFLSRKLYGNPFLDSFYTPINRDSSYFGLGNVWGKQVYEGSIGLNTAYGRYKFSINGPSESLYYFSRGVYIYKNIYNFFDLLYYKESTSFRLGIYLFSHFYTWYFYLNEGFLGYGIEFRFLKDRHFAFFPFFDFYLPYSLKETHNEPKGIAGFSFGSFDRLMFYVDFPFYGQDFDYNFGFGGYFYPVDSIKIGFRIFSERESYFKFSISYRFRNLYILDRHYKVSYENKDSCFSSILKDNHNVKYIKILLENSKGEEVYSLLLNNRNNYPFISFKDLFRSFIYGASIFDFPRELCIPSEIKDSLKEGQYRLSFKVFGNDGLLYDKFLNFRIYSNRLDISVSLSGYVLDPLNREIYVNMSYKKGDMGALRFRIWIGDLDRKNSYIVYEGGFIPRIVLSYETLRKEGLKDGVYVLYIDGFINGLNVYRSRKAIFIGYEFGQKYKVFLDFRYNDFVFGNRGVLDFSFKLDSRITLSNKDFFVELIDDDGNVLKRFYRFYFVKSFDVSRFKEGRYFFRFVIKGKEKIKFFSFIIERDPLKNFSLDIDPDFSFSPDLDGYRDILLISPSYSGWLGIKSYGFYIKNSYGETVYSYESNSPVLRNYKYFPKDMFDFMPSKVYKIIFWVAFDDGRLISVSKDFSIGFSLIKGEEGYILRFTDVLFDKNGDLTSFGRKLIFEFINRVYVRYPDYKIQVNVYTDTYGDELENLKKTEDMALKVVKFMRRMGIPEDKISFRGYGEVYPLFEDRNNEVNRSKNRRVDLVLIKGS